MLSRFGISVLLRHPVIKNNPGRETTSLKSFRLIYVQDIKKTLESAGF